jgi:DHA1 family multidrug resistance protein-like MFS transporter
MVGVQAIMSFAVTSSAPFLPLFIIQLGVHPLARVELWAGAIASINFLFAALFSPFWGSLADRSGRKAMVLRSSSAICVFMALMGLARDVWQLFGLRALMGVFSGFSATAMALVGTQVPEERLGFALGWMATGQLLGGLCGPLAGGLLADRLHDYRPIFYVTSACAFAAMLVCALAVRERVVSGAAAGSRPAPGWRELGDLLRNRRLAALFVVVLLAQVSAFGVSPIVSIFVRSLVGDTAWLATLAGAAFAVTGLADLLASPWLGKRSDRIGYRRVLLISLGGVAFFTLAQAFARDVWSFLAMRFAVGAFLGGVLPSTYAWAGRLFPAEHRGRVYGIASSASFFGMFTGPLLGANVAARFGFPAVFLTFGSLTLLNLLWVAAALKAPTDRVREPSSPPPRA